MTFSPSTAITLAICAVIFLICMVMLMRMTRRRDVYLHIKSGREYVLLYIGRLEADQRKCVVYASAGHVEDPVIWVREYNEFFDGRFVKVRTVVQ